MLDKTDLNDAVSEGIITAEQAEQLKAFATSLHPDHDNLLSQQLETRDEPFRLLRGFRDVFIALGILFFCFGATSLYSYSMVAASTEHSGFDYWLSSKERIIGGIVGVLLLLLFGTAMAEIVTKKLRLPLASLVLSIAMALWCGWLGLLILGSLAPTFFTYSNSSPYLFYLIFFSSAFAGISLFYARYRLPFVSLVIAASLVGLAYTAWSFLAPDSGLVGHFVIIGLLGVAVFCVAMFFDTKDRLRVTRLSENAFWLHLLAAPLMIHSIFATSSNYEISAWMVLIVFSILTFVALIIDRRAILVSSLIYMSNAFTQIVGDLGVDSALNFALPILFIGALVLVLGIGWSPFRRVVMSRMPSSIAMRTPPIA